MKILITINIKNNGAKFDDDQIDRVMQIVRRRVDSLVDSFAIVEDVQFRSAVDHVVEYESYEDRIPDLELVIRRIIDETIDGVIDNRALDDDVSVAHVVSVLRSRVKRLQDQHDMHHRYECSLRGDIERREKRLSMLHEMQDALISGIDDEAFREDIQMLTTNDMMRVQFRSDPECGVEIIERAIWTNRVVPDIAVSLDRVSIAFRVAANEMDTLGDALETHYSARLQLGREIAQCESAIRAYDNG